jgi:uncharacterized protein (TIGR03118 family)
MRLLNVSVLVGLAIFADGALSAATPPNAYVQHNLVADTAGVADFTDPQCINPWGIAASATGPMWVNLAGTGLSVVYQASGSPTTTRVTVPPSAGGKSPSVATGIVFNGVGGFAIATGRNPNFIFTTQDGTISAWNSAVDATHGILKVDNSASGAVYDGLAISSGPAGPYLYAPNFHTGKIEVYDTNYAAVTLAGSFADPSVPDGFAPFNIWNIGGKLYVTYAKQDAAKKFDVGGVGNGYVAIFDLNGNLLQHLISGGPLNSPWGVAIAPPNFGAFGGALLVGNFQDGLINAFDPSSGALLGTLQDPNGNPIKIPGLWALWVGNGGTGGDPNTIYFAAGVGGQQHGLLGSLQGAPVISASSIANAADGQTVIAPNTWISIYGANLAATTRNWTTKDFANNRLPTALDNVTVTINGETTYVYYVSPKQLNVLAPVDIPVGGPVTIQVSNSGLAGTSANIPAMPYSPAPFFFKTGPYIAAVHSDNVTPVGPASLFPNSSVPAKPGEKIVIYGTGFGDTNPAVNNGQVTYPSSGLPLATTPVVFIGNTQAQVTFAGVSAPGLYQFNVTVPSTAPDGDVLCNIQIGSFSTPPGGVIAVQH